MAGAAGKVIGVEVVPQAVADATGQRACGTASTNAEFFCGDAGQAALELDKSGVRPDVVVVDPPRKGLNADTIEALHRMSPRRIVYVSCDPGNAGAGRGAADRAGLHPDKPPPPWTCSRRRAHVETVVLLSHKKADSYIHIDVEFGEGEGKIPVDSIAKRAEAYKPKEKVTYKMIKEYIEAKYGFKVHTAYIAEVKRNLGLPMYDAPNAVEELKQPRKHPTPEKVEAIKDALRYFAVI